MINVETPKIRSSIVAIKSEYLLKVEVCFTLVISINLIALTLNVYLFRIELSLKMKKDSRRMSQRQVVISLHLRNSEEWTSNVKRR